VCRGSTDVDEMGIPRQTRPDSGEREDTTVPKSIPRRMARARKRAMEVDTMNAQSSSMNDLVNAVVRDLVATQAGPTRRDLGPDMASTSTAAAPSPEDAQRFFGAILGPIIANVVPQVASGILGMLQQRRRELGMPEQRDAASVERDLQSILASLLPKLIEAVPTIAGALSGRPAPRSTEEEGQRFLPILGAILPAVISAVPGIISAFNRQRGAADATQPSISNPDVAQRFLGPLLQTIVPPLLQSAPTILQSIFGGGRDVSQSGSRAAAAW
jgi:hypothetical protein